MKKTGLIALLLPTVILSSCGLTVFDYWIDEVYDLRVVRYSDRSKTVAVDEYYYHGDKYDGEITINITIHESIEVDGEGLKVKALGDGLFADNANLKRVVIPGSVTSIGASAFASCASLSSIYIPGNAAIIGEYAFDQNTSLTIYCEASFAIEWWDENWNDEIAAWFGAAHTKSIWRRSPKGYFSFPTEMWPLLVFGKDAVNKRTKGHCFVFRLMRNP